MSMKRMWTKEELGGGGVTTHHISIIDGLWTHKFDVVDNNPVPYSEGDINNLLSIPKPVISVDGTPDHKDRIGIICYDSASDTIRAITTSNMTSNSWSNSGVYVDSVIDETE